MSTLTGHKTDDSLSFRTRFPPNKWISSYGFPVKLDFFGKSNHYPGYCAQQSRFSSGTTCFSSKRSNMRMKASSPSSPVFHTFFNPGAARQTISLLFHLNSFRRGRGGSMPECPSRFKPSIPKPSTAFLVSSQSPT